MNLEFLLYFSYNCREMHNFLLILDHETDAYFIQNFKNAPNQFEDVLRLLESGDVVLLEEVRVAAICHIKHRINYVFIYRR